MSDRSDYEIQTNTHRISGIHEEKEVGKTGRPFFFDVTTNVKVGDYFNAAKAQLDFGSAGTGEVAGMASAFNAEMICPNKTVTSGSYVGLEVNYNMQASTSLQTTVPQAMASFKVGGNQTKIDQWEDEALSGVFSFQGLTDADASVFSTGTAETMTGTLKIIIGGTAYYLMLCSSGATT